MRAERAEDCVALDVSHLLGGAIGDAFIFGTGRSRPHMLRVAKAVKFELKARDTSIFHRTPTIEGKHSDDWLLIDGGSVVVSVMVRAARERLALESHWEEQGARRLELPPEEAVPMPLPPGAAAAAALPGESRAADDIPPPPAHWAVADDPTLDSVYRDGDDAALLAAVEAIEAARGEAAAADETATARDDADDDGADDEYAYDDYYDGEYFDGYYEDNYYGDEYYVDEAYADDELERVPEATMETPPRGRRR